MNTVFLGCVVGSAALVVVTCALGLAKRLGYLEETR